MQAARLDSAADYLDLCRWASGTPGAVALAAPGREPLTYSALWNHLTATSDSLHQAGFDSGQVAALALPNGPDFLTAALAITLRSACAPLELNLTPDESRINLQRVRASTLILPHGDASPLADAAREMGLRLIHIQASPGAPAGVFHLGEIEGPSGDTPGRQTGDALLMMTSATTGTPKLVPRSRDALRTAAAFDIEALQLHAADRYLSCMPLGHSHGIGAAVAQLSAGGLLFCAPAFDVAEFPSWLESVRPTWMSASPTMQRILLTMAREAPEIFQPASLRFVRSASAAPDPEVFFSLEKVLGVPVLNGYGLTEAPSAIRSTPAERKPGAVGKCQRTEVAILDESGEFLPPESEGEILLRGPTVMSGYLDNPEANQAAFHQDWFRTGDLGRLDRDGFLFIVGRRKEMISRGGKKVSPQEVDNVLATHPAIAEVATFGIPHRSLGEDVAAAAVLRPGAELTELELRRYAAEQLAAYKIPRRIVFVESVPRTAVGKPKRGALTDEFRNLGRPSRRPPSESPETPRPPNGVEAQLLGIWRRVLGVEQVGIQDDFFDLGGDSLSAALMLAQAEKLLDPGQGPLNGTGFFDEPTIVSLARILAQSAVSPAPAPSGPNRVLTLQKDGSRIPFFYFSSTEFDPYEFRYVSQELGPNQPLIVVCPSAAVQDDRRMKIAEIARQSVASIRALREHGPYVLGGFCYGGVVAFETARQLAGEGEQIALLALFDTPTPGYPKPLRGRKRYTAAIARLMRGLIRRDRDALATLATQAGQLAAKHLGLPASRSNAAGDPGQTLPTSLTMREYVPQVLSAPLVHFIAADSVVAVDRKLAWENFAGGGIQIRTVAGGHNSLFTEEHAPALAAALEEVLQAAGAPFSRAVSAGAGGN